MIVIHRVEFDRLKFGLQCSTSFLQKHPFRFCIVQHATEFSDMRMKDDKLGLLLCLSTSRGRVRFLKIRDLRLQAFSFISPPTAVVDLIVVCNLEVIEIGSKLAVFFPNTANRISICLELWEVKFESGQTASTE